MFRLLFCLFLSVSLAVAAVPRQPAVIPEAPKHDCCASMKTPPANHECERHAPKPDPDQQCCAACASGLAAIGASATPFVYPSTGDETFAAYLSAEHLRSDRPPVPPPRA
jgi:hypothetical protein